ncbi:hypothetical protein EJ08DRAFT_678478 [Tothia fuscella]|uniref:CMP/dCMP-type deaminase domain-containing protein n=1 Tax=Tothia fuscella TaxID=1048955 RepID=A0A9P4NT14_9PEZI|nr:hypothetical protein EJ08DRAFT_678478 [Tothia fuscella]
MKTDNYLTLCLEQAALSPLHYRHGCIIVRGGKVIGQGYNDHRPGFDGGALKTGRIGSGAYDGPAIADMKRKRKSKSKPDLPTTKTFTPYEGMGGGPHANVPLSMHSEMMAIHSALARSSTLASTAVSSIKPSFKLPGHSKRKARLRTEALKAYVESVCIEALEKQSEKQSCVAERRDGKSQVQEWRFEATASRPGQAGGEQAQEQGGRRGRGGSSVENYGETPREESEEYSSQERVSVRVTLQQHASKRSQDAQNISSKSAITNNNQLVPDVASEKEHGKLSKNPKYRPARHKQAQDKLPPKKTETMLVLNGPTRSSNVTVTDRMKHPRLNGADCYVARFGGFGKSTKKPPPCGHTVFEPSCTTPNNLSADTVSEDDLTLSRTSTSSGSLHDELLNPHPRITTPTSKPGSKVFDWNTVHASRPCYRCVAYMHSVGIKRVFWTNDRGAWEGAKIRDLVDALDSSSCSSGEDGGRQLLGGSVFITKHEVLMMRRMMGGS